ncbi:polygalacturonase [Collimonas sp. OK242]|uniref:glycoside hydrolase family 28 protein n=1 Tax=Collimonas sp. OK242 TaxID=1798195 RepID=UPI000895AB9F|nr:glycosyl hydrolase family 28 protein [Collimonas sp. OK242]SDY64735.1 polygalacturonase [Collimonas sp. OK242]
MTPFLKKQSFITIFVCLIFSACVSACGGGASDAGTGSGISGTNSTGNIVSNSTGTGSTGTVSTGTGSTGTGSTGTGSTGTGSTGTGSTGTGSTGTGSTGTGSTGTGSTGTGITSTNVDATLPAEPQLPGTVCATLTANLQQTAGLLPASIDASLANSNPDTARIQTAISNCPAGQAVKLTTSSSGQNAFLSGPITLSSGVTLWIDQGVTLFASRSPADFDTGAGNCGTAAGDGKSCNALITASKTQNSGVVGDGIIDGRGGSVLTSGANAGIMTWWDVAMLNKSTGKNQNNPRLIQLFGGSNFTLYRITVQNAPAFHVVPNTVSGFTAWGVKILTPTLAYSKPGYACPAGSSPDPTTPATSPSTCFTPETTKNTDGLDPGQSNNVLIAYSYFSGGDDNIAIKASGSAAALSHRIVHSHFYYGHGMSIGSETNSGVDGIAMRDLSFDGQDSPNGVGIRIKSDDGRGGEVKNISYQQICMRNVKEPMIFDPYYSPGNHTSAPNFHDITVSGFHYLGSAKYGGGTLTFNGYALNGTVNPLKITLDNVIFDSAPKISNTPHNGGPTPPSNTQFTMGPGPVNFTVASSAANNVTVTELQKNGQLPLDCSQAFVSFPSSASPF